MTHQLSPRALGIGLALAVAALLVPFAYAAVNEDHPAGTIGAGYVTLGADHIRFGSNLDAFIPTGSDSQRCLVTFGESNVGAGPFNCVHRRIDGVDGIRVVMGFPFDLPNDVFVQLTVYQQFAKGYGQPVLCSVEAC